MEEIKATITLSDGSTIDLSKNEFRQFESQIKDSRIDIVKDNMNILSIWSSHIMYLDEFKNI